MADIARLHWPFHASVWLPMRSPEESLTSVIDSPYALQLLGQTASSGWRLMARTRHQTGDRRRTGMFETWRVYPQQYMPLRGDT